MTARRIDGKAAAAGAARRGSPREVARFRAATGRAPGPGGRAGRRRPGQRGLCPLQGQGDARSRAWRASSTSLPADTSEAELLALVDRLNADPAVDGILVQLPLPAQIDDRQGHHPRSTPTRTSTASTRSTPAGWRSGSTASSPARRSAASICSRPSSATLPAWTRWSSAARTSSASRWRCCCCGESCTVTIAHSRTRDLPDVVRRADIVVAAVGRPEMVTRRLAQARRDRHRRRHQPPDPADDGKGRLVGDVDFDVSEPRSPARSPRCPAGSGR